MRNLFVLLLLVGAQLSASAQTLVHRDAEIERYVAQVSADSLRAYIAALVGFGTRHTLSTQTDPTHGIGAAQRWVLAKFKQFGQQSGGRFTASIESTTYAADGRRIDRSFELGNVVGVLRGTDPADSRLFVISGHLDSRVSDVMNSTSPAPGANDDGSGVAAVLECARILAASRFPATVVFLAVSGEEQGLLGAAYYAKQARAANLSIEAVLNNDIMGSNNASETRIVDNTRVRVFSEGLPAYELAAAAPRIRQYGTENDGPARQLARYVKEVGQRYVDNLEVVLIYRNDRFLRGGDHSAFVEQGYPAVRICEMNENYEHQHQDLRTENGVVYGDLLEFMDFEYLRKNTALNLASLANLAKAPGRPQQVTIDTRGLTNTTTLSWQPPATGRSAGYYVLVRETTSAVWQQKRYTTQTTLTLPLSKDNYYLAVQAVTETGNESLPVVPTPGR
ncbi:MAG: M20/M25/M40 family metallo-hydrolase [Bacteroidia bacterium]|nr:M20/M25/M40 family metallo-hydrolase [Bacteroidia bacterium]